ncbi:TetR/AcrR family transcriptional regulator [Emcibacter sp.]|uniref:TetR/AcrR family transcriptional regulator n=1 Tax=Emcibacter sp. TaxID=1979954 RepID=UPI002AA759D5|nr:TetR/AcrR family transcriptional regulator [Emcibacter sp.]
MIRSVQKRTLETRAKLIAAAQEIIDESGYAALRVEEVVLRAGMAKGTFFAHFKDKDALMDLIIGSEIDRHLDALEASPAPQTVEQMADALMPLCNYMTCERYVFDVILRFSGAAAIEEIGLIARTFGRQIEVFEAWLADAPFRRDIAVELRAEGIHAFMIQAMSAQFCALHNAESIQDRLLLYLRAWLLPGG